MCQKQKEKQNMQKNQKQNNKHRQKQMGMLFFRHIYKPKICGFSVMLARMDDFSDNIFLRAAFGGSIEIPVTTSSSSPSTSTCTSASSAATFSDAPQGSTSKGKGRAKLQPRGRNATHHKYSKLQDHLILKAVELKGRDLRTVLAFLKTNWEGPRDHMLGIFCYCKNCEFPGFERPHHFIAKISTSFEVEKIPALKQTLVFMSKIWKKIFKDGKFSKSFSKIQSIFKFF